MDDLAAVGTVMVGCQKGHDAPEDSDTEHPCSLCPALVILNPDMVKIRDQNPKITILCCDCAGVILKAIKSTPNYTVLTADPADFVKK